MYSLTLREETGWFSDIWQEARERIFLDTTLVRANTYLTHGGSGYVYWNLPPYETPVAIIAATVRSIGIDGGGFLVGFSLFLYKLPIGRKIRAPGRVSAVLNRSSELAPAGGSQRSELDSLF